MFGKYKRGCIFGIPKTKHHVKIKRNLPPDTHATGIHWATMVAQLQWLSCIIFCNTSWEKKITYLSTNGAAYARHQNIFKIKRTQIFLNQINTTMKKAIIIIGLYIGILAVIAFTHFIYQIFHSWKKAENQFKTKNNQWQSLWDNHS